MINKIAKRTLPSLALCDAIIKIRMNSYMYFYTNLYRPINITSGSLDQLDPIIAIDSSNNLHIVWRGRTSAFPNHYQIRYAKSTDGGNTWSSPINITNGSYNQLDQKIAIDSSNNLHIVWRGESSTSPNYTQIRYAKSTDGGNTWSSPVNITSESYNQLDPKIAIDSSNNLHIVWGGPSSESPNYSQIRYAKSTDGGNTWSSPVNITTESYSHYEPIIAIDSSNNLHIVWEELTSEYPNHYQIRYAKSTDGGNTWSSPVNITNESLDQYDPIIAIDSSNNLHIVWIGPSSASPNYYYFQIRYAKSTDGGNTWSSPIDITNESYSQYAPIIAIDSSNNLHIVWGGRSSESPNYSQIRYAKSTDGGNTWSSPVNISNDNNDQYKRVLAIDSSNNLHIVWIGASSASPDYTQIRYAKSTDGGNTWSSPVNITNDNFNQRNPSVAIDSYNKLHIAWEGWESDTSGYYFYPQIRYMKV